jgi:hypothetical protein
MMDIRWELTDHLQPHEEMLTFFLGNSELLHTQYVPVVSALQKDYSGCSFGRGKSVLTMVVGLLFFVICQGMCKLGNIQ